MKDAPKKVFIIDKGSYLEISYQEFCKRRKLDAVFAEKRVILIQGMLLEVPEKDYTEFYRKKRRQRYLNERAEKNGDISYDMLTSSKFRGKDILKDSQDVQELVEQKLMLEKLWECIPMLTADEKKLIFQVYCEGLTERKLAEIYGTSQATVHKRKRRILEKLKNFMEI